MPDSPPDTTELIVTPKTGGAFLGGSAGGCSLGGGGCSTGGAGDAFAMLFVGASMLGRRLMRRHRET